MKLILEHIVQGDELKKLIEQGQTLQEISNLAFQRCGRRWSTAGISKLCSKHEIQMPRSGPRNGHLHKGWKGGRTENKDGYIEIYSYGHPNAKKHTHYILEHRLVVEKDLGRFLLKTEVVHHKNGVKTDNRLENLELFESNAKHLAATLKGNVPKWTEQGKANILAANLRPKKPANYSQEEIQRRRARCQLRNAIQRELKLCVPPNTLQSHHYLEGLGMSWLEALNMVATHGLQFFLDHSKPIHEMAH
jgi:hypothetical protein